MCEYDKIGGPRATLSVEKRGMRDDASTGYKEFNLALVGLAYS